MFSSSWLRKKKASSASARCSAFRVRPLLEQLERRDLPAPLSSNIFAGVGGTPNVNGTLFLSADDGVHGQELWKSDGTTAGTVLVKDINPGINSSLNSNLMKVNGTVFFSANDGVHGLELWKSDGTPEGTALVKDILPGSAGNLFIALLGDINGRLFFSADDGVHGRELWTSDGTEAGTTLFKDISPGLGSSNPVILTSVYPLVVKDGNGLAYLLANDGVHGEELWRTDGTPDGTFLLKDINPGSVGSSPAGNLAIVNGIALFLAHDGVHGGELWKSDGTPDGTVLLKDINPGSAASFPEIVRVVNGVMYFSAADGTHGRELWRSDGTADGTSLVKDIFAGSSDANPNGLMDVNGTLYFHAIDAIHGREVWKSDGTPDGTVLLKDITAGSPGSSLIGLNNVNGTLVFSINDGVHGGELWKSDGSEAGTALLKDIQPGPGSGLVFTSLGIVNGTLFIRADDGIHGDELWKSDGTAAGTVLVKDINPIGTPHSQTLGGDFEQTTETVPVRIKVLANDSFAPGVSGTVTAVSAPAHGTAVIDADGTITYTSVAGYSFDGYSFDDRFTYTVTNTLGEVDTVQVFVRVFSRDFLGDDYAQTSQDTPVTINILNNDYQTPGAAITAVTTTAHGTAVANADGTITYTPAAGFYGTDTFTYTVSNSVGGVDTATVTVEVIQRVQIDIKPGSTTNAIHLNNDGEIVVNLFSSANFDTTTVDIGTVLFAGAGVKSYGLEDVNRDGRLDLVLHFRIDDTNLRAMYSQLLLDDYFSDGTLDSTRQQTNLLLSGNTTDGKLWEGLDSATLFESGQVLKELLSIMGLQ